MIKSPSIREIIMFGLMLVLSFFLIVKKWNHSELEQDKARNEERIKIYEQNLVQQHHISDSLKLYTKELEKSLKSDTIIIIKKYETIRNNINLLNAGQSISYLSKRLSQASSNR